MSAIVAKRTTAATLCRPTGLRGLRWSSCYRRAPRLAVGNRPLQLELSIRGAPAAARLAWFPLQVRWSSADASGGEQATTKYTFDDIRSRLPTAGAPAAPNPSPSPLILIDVREPAELAATGRIPTAHNLPISTFPNGPFLPADEFLDKFGFDKPPAGAEVVFYCKSGVRSRTAAAMVAPEWGKQGVRVCEFPGSWNEWFERGGEVER